MFFFFNRRSVWPTQITELVKSGHLLYRSAAIATRFVILMFSSLFGVATAKQIKGVGGGVVPVLLSTYVQEGLSRLLASVGVKVCLALNER